MKDALNRRIKFREPFRPFCPSVLAEATGEWPVAFALVAAQANSKIRWLRAPDLNTAGLDRRSQDNQTEQDVSRAGDVALFLPFECNKEQQRPAGAATKRRFRNRRFYER